jgi:hypothetical protein
MAPIAREMSRGAAMHFAGRNQMKRFYAGCAIAVAVTFGGSARLAPANAAPPTATPSPGYDARLQEQRAAASARYEPAVPAARPGPKRRVKRTDPR